MITLAIDASTYVGTVAVWLDAELAAEGEVAMRGADEERLMPGVLDALGRSGARVADVGRVVCGAGPGSFTSLRIAASIAKGIATGTGAPLHAVPSLGLIVAGNDLPPGTYLAALDALRGEAYVALYERGGDGVRELAPARIVPTAALEALAEEHGARLVGPARSPAVLPRASGSLCLGGGEAVDLESWEPAYGRLAEAQVKWEAAHGRPLPRG